jgi:hypothetical protein
MTGRTGRDSPLRILDLVWFFYKNFSRIPDLMPVPGLFPIWPA